MGLVRLAICVSGVYATFLLWAIAQERLVSVPFPSKLHPTRLQPPAPDNSHKGDRFPSPIFLTFAQAIASSLCAFTYLLFNAYRDGSLRHKGVSGIIGWTAIVTSLRERRAQPIETPGMMYREKMEAPLSVGSPRRRRVERSQENGKVVDLTDLDGEKEKFEQGEKETDVNGHLTVPGSYVSSPGGPVPWRRTLPGLVLQVAAFQTTAGPIGFLALEHISYPTMVLGKSCKLIPVLLLNVLIYRRRFSSHKYVVVGLVTLGISLFMLLGDKSKKGGSDSIYGFSLLLLNLFIDGLTNSTQDQIFTTYRNFTGQQMMFVMAILTQILLFPFLLLPLPTHPLSILHHLPIPLAPHLGPRISGAPIIFSRPAFFESIQFLLTHPTAFKPLIAFACLGGLGQLFIFETIQHFGSLTLVMVTVTRKLFTMLLSVIVFEHVLNKGQWIGVAVVFLGIAVEAGIKRMDVMKRARRDPK